MSRSYTAVFENVAVSAAQDLLELTPPPGVKLSITGLFVSQDTAVGDDFEEQLRLELVRGHTTPGTGGSPVVPVATDPDDKAAQTTVAANNTTIAADGSPEAIWAESFNVRSGYQQWWIPNAELRARSITVLRLLEDPVAPLAMTVTLVFEEV